MGWSVWIRVASRLTSLFYQNHNDLLYWFCVVTLQSLTGFISVPVELGNLQWMHTLNLKRTFVEWCSSIQKQEGSLFLQSPSTSKPVPSSQILAPWESLNMFAMCLKLSTFDYIWEKVVLYRQHCCVTICWYLFEFDKSRIQHHKQMQNQKQIQNTEYRIRTKSK